MQEDELKILQKQLDDDKYYASFHYGDLSGKMPYCEHCQFRLVNDEGESFCPCRQDIIEQESLCAKASLVSDVIESIKYGV